jgi:hypothetical protein
VLLGRQVGREVRLAVLEVLEGAQPPAVAAEVKTGAVVADEDTGLPRGLGFETIPGITMLMQDNKDRMVFARMTGKG